MKTITLTDDQFDTLFEYVDDKVTTIVDASVDYQDSEILNEWEDLLDVHTVLEEAQCLTNLNFQLLLQAMNCMSPSNSMTY